VPLFPAFRTLGHAWPIAAWLFASTAAWAATDHEEADIILDPRLELSELLETTLERHPQALVLRAGRSRVTAEEEFSSRWFPEAMELSGFHLSDRQLDDTGVYENEATLSFPLWLPGEKKAQNALSESVAVAQASRDAEFRWAVSGLLRRQLWNLTVAMRQWELAAEQENRLQEVLEQVSIFLEAGDLSRADLLSTMQELAIWKAETMTLEASYRDAVREYHALTGSRNVPADISEPLTAIQEPTDSHPALQNALDRLAQASAETEAVRQANSARPSVNVFWREFRGDRANPDVNALGLGFSMPLGKSPAQGPEVARANESLAMAEAGLLQTRRELDLQIHEARHLLNTTRQQLENSKLMVDAANEKYHLDQLSFELGEISVRQWLRRLSELKEIQRSHELLLMQQGAAIAAYNQAAGETL
jgi:outer membrane protein TolC